MLTQSEREWLEQREKNSEKHRGHYTEEFSRMRFEDLGYSGDLWDAAEFEARVAAKLAIHHLCTACPYPDGPNPRPCGWCLMKRARLAVEEEMDADGK